jgi:hypothetical protein
MPNISDIITAPVKVAGGLATLPLKVAGGLLEKVRGGGDATVSDPELKAKVESDLFRLPGVSRSNLNITVANGLVTLQGTARTVADIARIQTAARAIPGVEHLESELHVPTTPAPKSRPATRTRKPAATKPPAPTTADRVSELAPTPAEIAATGQGRPPAPFGSTETDS